ncbi:metalloregulator ArsR/SmtB family transcription factor [Sulfurimonas sp. SWIR-19]|uniref:ArsR/SmtB family transcription factor n=1 Tax=Sulfurimonas sp. SWIR-19 TaxID=2878390 RepID=UPI001CF55587|nr:metalloregulator ArsR/SmtB family transcription factor [Sulfurimonas sp. SWIR-19]UCN00222.1 metalloregulator ArsR/SmtB family transcription factor [Sulfurimonas sp. SWIR-19]
MKDENSCCRISVDSTLIEDAKACLEKNEGELLIQAKIFSLLGNDVRLKIIRLFLEFERMCVCDLADILAMKQSPISQHLRKLKDGGLLLNKREGMTIFYFINPRQEERLERLIKG